MSATSVPIVTVLVETVDFGPPGAPHDVLTELQQVVHQLGAGRIRGDLREVRYALAEDGTRTLIGIKILRPFAAQGADAAVILQRSAVHDNCPLHPTEEIHRVNAARTTLDPSVMVLIDAAAFASDDPYDEYAELLEIVWRLDAGRVRRMLADLRYDLPRDGTPPRPRSAEIVCDDIAQGEAAAVIRQRSEHSACACNDHNQEEEEEDPW